MESSNVFWLRDEKNRPITLIAWSVEGSTIRYASATHSLPDKFSRKNAHNKALGRLKQDKKLVSCTPLDAMLGPEATIAQHIIATRRGDTKLPPPHIHAAATVSFHKLAHRHTEKKERERTAVLSQSVQA